ncbi:MAG: nucleotide sugar dehydrogenase [Armatimonadetes bacterium]|nr:nucleotide sugar dehydrogenase [Armatimonadota bacterium]MDW8153877.1 nucleotide sugar dehydrogenase [Armatimonadota bacterium]
MKVAVSQGELESRIRSRRARVGVVGLGYVGLPLAVAVAEAGFPVVGMDVDEARVESIRSGRSYIDDVDACQLTPLVRSGRLTVTTRYEELAEAEVLLICVPTPLTRSKEPDLSYVYRAAEGISRVLRPGRLVILESTTYPGTTEEVLRPLLERSGLRAGVDFYLAFSPERIDPGNRRYSLREVPKVVGGCTERCTEAACAFYAQFIERVVPVSSPTVAEMVKVYENVFRNVNIALVNELTLLCDRMGLDVWEIIEAAATKPYGFMPFYPGPGVGGHCIPIDPYYLAAKAREYDFHVRFIELAAAVNDSMPYYVLSKATTALGMQGKTLQGARTLVLGVAYKRDVSDARESPALKIMELLEKRGAVVRYHDPHVPQVRLPNPGEDLASVPLTDEVLAWADCVIIATDHTGVDYRKVVERARLVIDTRNVLRDFRAPHVVRL